MYNRNINRSKIAANSNVQLIPHRMDFAAGINRENLQGKWKTIGLKIIKQTAFRFFPHLYIHIARHRLNRVEIQYLKNQFMLPDFAPFTGLLPDNKWTSKFDFIARLKSNGGETEENRQRLLRFLNHLHFSFIKRGIKGELLLL